MVKWNGALVLLSLGQGSDQDDRRLIVDTIACLQRVGQGGL